MNALRELCASRLFHQVYILLAIILCGLGVFILVTVEQLPIPVRFYQPHYLLLSEVPRLLLCVALLFFLSFLAITPLLAVLLRALGQGKLDDLTVRRIIRKLIRMGIVLMLVCVLLACVVQVMLGASYV